MSSRKSLKQRITEAVLAELPNNINPHSGETVDKLMFTWWATGRQGKEGLRLSDVGHTAFKLAQIEYYDYPLRTANDANQNWNTFLLEMNRKLKCPYYLGVHNSPEVDTKHKQPYIRLYDSKIAMMIGLYGTLAEYLESVKIRQ